MYKQTYMYIHLTLTIIIVSWGSIPRRSKIFLFSIISRPMLGPTQLHIQRVLGAVSLGVKRLGHEVDHSPLSSAQVKYGGT
jgi:hypothetical protein